MKTCQKCLNPQDYICLDCGGCEECCKCPTARQLQRWVHIATLEGAMKRNDVLRAALRPAGAS